MMKAPVKDTDNNFTPLRLLLALLVVFGHFQAFVGVKSPPWPYNYAATAVDCFFVVSGYLVTNSFDRDPNLYRFYTRRFFRIYPLYLVVIILQALALGAIEPAGYLANAGSIGKYLFFNSIFANFAQHDVGNGVLTGLADPSLNASLWTLKIEFAFYLLVPFLWRLTMRYGDLVLAAIFGLSVIYFEALSITGHETLAKQLPGQMQFFVLGIAAYKYRDLWVSSRTLAAILTVLLGAMVTAIQRSHPPVIFPLAVGAFVIVAALRAPRLRINSDISYGVYLLHAPIIQLALLFGLYRPGIAGLAPILLLLIVLATIAEQTIEKPGIALGRRLARKITQTRGPDARPAGAAAAGADDLCVVVMNDFCYVQGGASKVAVDEAVALAQAGIRVTFLGAVGPVCAELQDAPLTVHCLGQGELLNVARRPGVALQGIWNRAAARETRAILGALPRDRTIVHLHGYTKALTTSPVRAAKRLGIPVICTLHDFFAACPNGAFFDYTAGRPCNRRALSAACVARDCDKRHYAHKLFRVVRGLVQRHSGSFPAAVTEYISLSRRSETLLAPYLPRDAHLHALPNVIDADPAETAVDPARNRAIVCVGRLDQEKGVMLIAGLARRLGISVVFVGDGPLRAQLEAVPGVTVTGWVPSERVHEYLANARCLVFPSLWYETYGLVVAEAAARGIPAIVSDISAAAERIEEGVTGWSFRSGSADDLARCLKVVEDDGAVRAAGRAAYRAFWSNPETRSGHARKLVDIYRLAMRAG
jgi:peptidoglycan/LPS O-acetylase OafA/YrhL/glycosyltransferase involved in cell wall biosynthesis